MIVFESGSIVSLNPERAGDVITEALGQALTARTSGAVRVVREMDAVRRVTR